MSSLQRLSILVKEVNDAPVQQSQACVEHTSVIGTMTCTISSVRNLSTVVAEETVIISCPAVNVKRYVFEQKIFLVSSHFHRIFNPHRIHIPQSIVTLNSLHVF
jgi:hypothetical protein